MPSFSPRSMSRLRTCDARLISLFEDIVVWFDCSILDGHRGEDAQNAAYGSGRSQLPWPEGRHNAYPSKAVDVVPDPIDPDDRERMTLFAGVGLGYARAKGIPLRGGGDWDRDTEVADNTFDDFAHFEIDE